MKTTELENMTAAELKAAKDETLAAELAESPDLRLRYVRAVKSAKTRDEKLAEQGRTITTLQDTLDRTLADLTAAGQTITKMDRMLEGATTALKAEEKKLEECKSLHAKEKNQLADAGKKACDEHDAAIADLNQKLAAATDLAKRRRAVLAELAGKITPLLAEEM